MNKQIKLNYNIFKNKNLLAFSAGIDSTALFFILLDHNISFDIAIVDYNQRIQSKDEVIYATQLAHKYNKKCFISNYHSDKKFSEKSARDFRHNFFDTIINEHHYDTLITAHQLNDKLEWFLMQFSKGAGLDELLGMKEESSKDNYTVLKPLLNYEKKELLEYLEQNNIKYFVDSTNIDQKYKRNYFRHNFSEKLLTEFSSGIKKSFKYLEVDSNILFKDKIYCKHHDLHIYKNDMDINVAIRLIDKDLKKRGIMISKATRDEIISKKEVTIAHKIAITITPDLIWIAPFVTLPMDKKFKEICRVKKIPKNIRGYIFKYNWLILS